MTRTNLVKNEKLEIPGDRIRESVPWRLRHEDSAEELLDQKLKSITARPGFEAEEVEALPELVAARVTAHGHTEALASDAVGLIAEEFGFDVVAIERLSRELAKALNPTLTPYKLKLPREVAIMRAQTAMNATVKNLLDAADSMTRGIERLDPLDTNEAGDREGAQRFEEFRAEYDTVLRYIEALHRKLRFLSATPDIALDMRPEDKREVPDGRRRRVLFCIFRFWENAGRSLGISTDPHSSERFGRLVKFVNAVVRCVTEPSRGLSGDTIMDDRDAYRAMRRSG